MELLILNIILSMMLILGCLLLCLIKYFGLVFWLEGLARLAGFFGMGYGVEVLVFGGCKVFLSLMLDPIVCCGKIQRCFSNLYRIHGEELVLAVPAWEDLRVCLRV